MAGQFTRGIARVKACCFKPNFCISAAKMKIFNNQLYTGSRLLAFSVGNKVCMADFFG